jgi:hypothetical protein
LLYPDETQDVWELYTLKGWLCRDTDSLGFKSAE